MELTDCLDSELADALRACVFAELVGDPLSWRVRRVDSFRTAEWVDVEQTIKIDARIDRELVSRALERLKDGLSGDEGPRAAMVAEAATAVGRHTQLGKSADAADLLIPVLWRSGPTLDADVRVDGHVVAPLNRREAADVVGRFFRSQLATLQAVKAISMESTVGLWKSLGWCMTATDISSLRGQGALRPLAGLDIDRDFLAIRAWMVENVARDCLGGRTAAESIVTAHHDWIRGLVARSHALRATWSVRVSGESSPESDVFNPALNPLLMQYSFSKYLKWVTHQTGGGWGLPEDAGPAVLCAFLNVCSGWMDIAEWILSAAGDADVTRLGEETLRFAAKIGVDWPLIVRVRVPLDQTVRFESEAVVVTEGANAFAAEYDLTSRRPWVWVRLLDTLIRRPARAAVGLWKQMSLGRRHGGSQSARFSQSYPLACTDPEM